MLKVRAAQVSDLKAVSEMYRDELRREPSVDKIAAHIRDYPSAVAEEEGSLIGFCYTSNFAPDILELANIVVSGERRNAGVGSRLLEHVEVQAVARFAAIILINSDLYPQGESKKRPATQFYLRHAYRILTATPDTRIFFKDLR